MTWASPTCSHKAQTDNPTEWQLRTNSRPWEKTRNSSTCRIRTEDSYNNQSQYGLNRWTCSVHLYNNSAHPHFQQARIEVNYKLDKHANDNAQRGYIEIRKGEKTFWKALDDSNDAKNVERVQKAIGDDRPTDFSLRDTKIEFVRDEKGNVVDVSPKTKGLW